MINLYLGLSVLFYLKDLYNYRMQALSQYTDLFIYLCVLNPSMFCKFLLSFVKTSSMTHVSVHMRSLSVCLSMLVQN
jgi:hypothetical protein